MGNYCARDSTQRDVTSSQTASWRHYKQRLCSFCIDWFHPKTQYNVLILNWPSPPPPPRWFSADIQSKDIKHRFYYHLCTTVEWMWVWNAYLGICYYFFFVNENPRRKPPSLPPSPPPPSYIPRYRQRDFTRKAFRGYFKFLIPQPE